MTYRQFSLLNQITSDFEKEDWARFETALTQLVKDRKDSDQKNFDHICDVEHYLENYQNELGRVFWDTNDPARLDLLCNKILYLRDSFLEYEKTGIWARSDRLLQLLKEHKGDTPTDDIVNLRLAFKDLSDEQLNQILIHIKLLNYSYQNVVDQRKFISDDLLDIFTRWYGPRTKKTEQEETDDDA